MVQRQKGEGKIKGEEKKEKEYKRGFQYRNASSRAFRYQRFGVGIQEHSSTIHDK